jgi:ribonuclease P protein component
VYDFIDDATVALQAGVTVSSRTFKKAVQRNRVKRVLREAYRLQKLPLQSAIEQTGKHLVLFFIYTGKELPVYGDVYEKIRIVLQKVHEKI